MHHMSPCEVNLNMSIKFLPDDDLTVYHDNNCSSDDAFLITGIELPDDRAGFYQIKCRRWNHAKKEYVKRTIQVPYAALFYVNSADDNGRVILIRE